MIGTSVMKELTITALSLEVLNLTFLFPSHKTQNMFQRQP